MKNKTISDYLEAAAWAVNNPEEYDQTSWFGTPCCIHGRVRLQHGEEQSGPCGEEFSGEEWSTPRGRMIRAMLGWTHRAAAELIPLIREDGSILTDREYHGIGAGVEIGAGAVIHNGATIGSGTTIGRNVTVGRNASIDAHTTIGDDAVVVHDATTEPGDTIGAGVVWTEY